MLSSTSTIDLLQLEKYLTGVESWPRSMEGDNMSDQYFTPEHDVIEKLADGRTLLAAPAGVPVPMQIALDRGFVKPSRSTAPSETKTDEDQNAPIVSQAVYDRLSAAGFVGPDAIAGATDDDLLAVEGVGDATLQKLRAVHPTPAAPAATSTPTPTPVISSTGSNVDNGK